MTQGEVWGGHSFQQCPSNASPTALGTQLQRARGSALAMGEFQWSLPWVCSGDPNSTLHTVPGLGLEQPPLLGLSFFPIGGNTEFGLKSINVEVMKGLRSRNERRPRGPAPAAARRTLLPCSAASGSQ